MKSCKHERIKGLGFGGTLHRGKAVIIRVCKKCRGVFAEFSQPMKFPSKYTKGRRPVLCGSGVKP